MPEKELLQRMTPNQLVELRDAFVADHEDVFNDGDYDGAELIAEEAQQVEDELERRGL